MTDKAMPKRVRRAWAIRLSVVVLALAVLNSLWAHENPLGAKVADFGQWLSGVAGALAFVWLTVSYFQQSEELELQRDELAATREQLALQKVEMARLADEATRQAKSIEATEQHARRDTFMRLFELGQSIQATLIRSLDMSLFGSTVAAEASGTGRDYYLIFADFLDQRFLNRAKKLRHVSIQGDELFVEIWAPIPGKENWNLYRCRIAEVEQLLWFDQMLIDEATKADEASALVKFVEALPAQKTIRRLKHLLSEKTDMPHPPVPI